MMSSSAPSRGSETLHAVAVHAVAGVQDIARVTSDQLVVEAVMVRDDDHRVGSLELVAGGFHQSDLRPWLHRQVGVGDVHPRPESSKSPGDDRSGGLTGISRVLL